MPSPPIPTDVELHHRGARHGARGRWRYRRPTVSPLRVGSVPSVAGWARLSGCRLPTQSVRVVTVTDTTARTVVPVDDGNCARSELRSKITVTVASTRTGSTTRTRSSSSAKQANVTLPDGPRVVARTQSIEDTGQTTRFLRSAVRSVPTSRSSNLADNCAREGTATRTVAVAALENRNVAYTVSCTSGGSGPDPDPGCQYRATWSSLGGNQYALDLRIDMRTFNRPEHRRRHDGWGDGRSTDRRSASQVGYDWQRVSSFCNTCGSNGTGAEGGAAPAISGEPTIDASSSGVDGRARGFNGPSNRRRRRGSAVLHARPRIGRRNGDNGDHAADRHQPQRRKHSSHNERRENKRGVA